MARHPAGHLSYLMKELPEPVIIPTMPTKSYLECLFPYSSVVAEPRSRIRTLCDNFR